MAYINTHKVKAVAVILRKFLLHPEFSVSILPIIVDDGIQALSNTTFNPELLDKNQEYSSTSENQIFINMLIHLF